MHATRVWQQMIGSSRIKKENSNILLIILKEITMKKYFIISMMLLSISLSAQIGFLEFVNSVD